MINKSNNKKGFSLIEIILAVSIFALTIMGLIGGLIYGQQSNKMAIDRGQAIFLANEGIEATINISRENFNNLIDGTYGLIVENNSYSFGGSFDVWGMYERQITISGIDSNTKKIESNISWLDNTNKDKNLIFTTYITNWK